MSTLNHRPPDSQWDESPRGPASAIARSLGWVLVVAWVLATGGFALFELARSPEGLFVKVLVFGGLAGLLLLFLSVLVDRLRTARADPYREVER